MRQRLLCGFSLVLLALALFGSQASKQGSVNPEIFSAARCGEYGQGSVFSISADFDGDNQPDLAVGHNGGWGFTVQVRFRRHLPEATLTCPVSGPGIQIFSRDVDGDKDQDIIVASATSDIPLAIWLSDGKGHFRPTDPWAYLPKQFGTPLRCQTGPSPECSPCLTENDYPYAGIQATTPAIAEPEAGACVAGEPRQILLQDSISSFFARGPPLNNPLQPS
jgi:hypothetical protein